MPDPRFDFQICDNTLPQLLDFSHDLIHLSRRLPLTTQKPEANADADQQSKRDAERPCFHAAAQTPQVIAQLQDASLERVAVRERMKKVNIPLHAPAIGC